MGGVNFARNNPIQLKMFIVGLGEKCLAILLRPVELNSFRVNSERESIMKFMEFFRSVKFVVEKYVRFVLLMFGKENVFGSFRYSQTSHIVGILL